MQAGGIGDLTLRVAVLAIRPRHPFSPLAMAAAQAVERRGRHPTRPVRHLGVRRSSRLAEAIAKRLAAQNVRAGEQLPWARRPDTVRHEATVGANRDSLIGAELGDDPIAMLEGTLARESGVPR